MSQLTLFSSETDAASSTSASCCPDPDSEHLLTKFKGARLAEGAHPQSVRREVSQIRAVMREAGTQGQPVMLRDLVGDPGLIARALTEPSVPITRSTGRARLLAVQRFITAMGPSLGRDPASDLAALDALLPGHRSIGWHKTGTMVAGTLGRRRRRGPTLDAADLRRIVDAAAAENGTHAVRDRALVALHCFSGLRPKEIVGLYWEDLASELSASGHYGLTARVGRSGRRISLILPGPAADAIEALVRSMGSSTGLLSGPVFCSRGATDQPLSYRAVRDVLQAACRRADLPTVEAAALRAACAHWLRSQGLSDHEVADVLGLARVRSVDRLLQRHAALDAQRAAREVLVR